MTDEPVPGREPEDADEDGDEHAGEPVHGGVPPESPARGVVDDQTEDTPEPSEPA